MPQIFGADYRGLAGGQYAVALLHMVSLALVALALVLLAWRFFAGAELVDQLLGVAIAANILLFAITSAGAEGAHEIAVVAPFGAALAARMLIRPQPAGARADRAGARAGRPAARRARAGGYAAGAVVLLGYLGGLAHEVAQPASPPDFARSRVLAAGAWPAVRPGRLLGEQHHHRRDGRPGQGQGAGQEQHGAGSVAGPALVV